ncbi:MAG TPA: MarR family transcriptional regulator [Actinophytocola sp.]|jgi:DNA-binding MarR family transcriptional regulator|uniref:helix-turn-helix domain-containing protein n=1 Tax=Actinophytocola sp. TaxID=1872138 RepID=UPI002F950768
MDGGELHRLGKRLIDLSRQVTGEPGDLTLTPGEAAVLEDVIKHPNGSVSEISTRTGFVQSHVSASVSRLKRRRLLATAGDPRDGRRTRVRATRDTLRAVDRRGERGIDGTVRDAVGDTTKAGRVTALLDELADLLLPDRGATAREA